MNLNKKTYISLLITAALTLFLVFSLITPFFRKVKENSAELLLERKKMIILAQEKENIKNLEEVYKSFQSDFEKIDHFFVNPELPIDFINFLEKNAKEVEVKIKISGLVKKKEEGDFWPNLLLELSADGNFSNFLKFLTKLENGPYLIEITNFNITKASQKEIKIEESTGISLSTIQAHLSLKVFSR